MNFYPHHIGDYLTATAHLSWMEDCAYRRLLDLYYSREQAIPGDVVQAARLCRATTKDERKAVETVLAEFFTLTDKGWTHTRCEEEIVKAADAAERARQNGKRGGRPPKQKPTENPEITQPVSGGNPEESKSKAPNPNTNTNTSEAKASGGKPPKSPVDEEKAELWKALKASLVEQGTSADIKAAGVLLGKAAKDYGELVFLEACRETLREERVNTHTFLIGLCERAVGRRTGAQPKSFAQQDREEGMRRWEEMTGQVHPDRNPKPDNVIDIFPVAIGDSR